MVFSKVEHNVHVTADYTLQYQNHNTKLGSMRWIRKWCHYISHLIECIYYKNLCVWVCGCMSVCMCSCLSSAFSLTLGLWCLSRASLLSLVDLHIARPIILDLWYSRPVQCSGTCPWVGEEPLAETWDWQSTSGVQSLFVSMLGGCTSSGFAANTGLVSPHRPELQESASELKNVENDHAVFQYIIFNMSVAYSDENQRI